MAEVTIEVGGRSYRVGCDDGEEEHVRMLAQKIDGEAQKLQRGIGMIAEGRLLVMSALMVADKLSDAQKQIVRLERKLADAERAAAEKDIRPNGIDSAREDEIAARIERLAERLEGLGRDA